MLIGDGGMAFNEDMRSKDRSSHESRNRKKCLTKGDTAYRSRQVFIKIELR
jgi:hypothetical protein